jgi:2-polyprenyl-6-methoxyphenol hydroxylase-like FAD-dependent oxidoreductase
LDYEEVVQGLRGAGTHRALLLNVLLKAAGEAGAEVLWDHAILTLRREPDGRPLLCDGRGREHGPFDLVVLCDGAQSALRPQSGIPCRVSRYPWGALWFIGRRPAAFAVDTLWQRVGTTRELVGFLPTGTKEDLVSFFWSIRLADVEVWRRGDLAMWKRDVLCHAPQAAPLLDQITKHEQLAVAAYHDVRMPRWHGDRVAVLGDAGHALSPQLGQGVNLALIDAAQLAASLETRPLAEALVHFSEQRRKHLGFYQLTTRAMTPFFQSDWMSLGHVRDATFPLAGRIPWVRRQMVTTMAGLKTGIFGQLCP